MNSNERMNYLNGVLKGESVGSMNVAYKDSHVAPRKVYRINIDYLVYNQYNGRIRTLTKAYEQENGAINVESSQGKELIERFLWDSKPERNKRTMKNLEEMGQIQPGIVTLDGVIIDGNRRASLLKRIASNNNSGSAYFEAVILPDPMGENNAREIKKLETQYQMGMDEKLGYNALEKYLQIQDLEDNGFSVSEIANLTSYEENEVKRFSEIKSLMDEYLDILDYQNIYTRLENAEDWFWKLQESMQRFKGGGSTLVQWDYAEEDVNDLKLIMFDYIRASRESGSELLGGGQAYRDICSANKTGFFKDETIWKQFRDKHFDDFEQVEEKPISEYRAAHPGESFSNVLKQRDRDFSDQVEDSIKSNFNRTRNAIGTLNDRSQPKVLLESAIAKLEAIEPTSDTFSDMCKNDPTIIDLLRDIGKLQFELKKVAEKAR